MLNSAAISADRVTLLAAYDALVVMTPGRDIAYSTCTLCAMAEVAHLGMQDFAPRFRQGAGRGD